MRGVPVLPQDQQEAIHMGKQMESQAQVHQSSQGDALLPRLTVVAVVTTPVAEDSRQLHLHYRFNSIVMSSTT